jgi:hypothetical protein
MHQYRFIFGKRKEGNWFHWVRVDGDAIVDHTQVPEMEGDTIQLTEDSQGSTWRGRTTQINEISGGVLERMADPLHSYRRPLIFGVH